MEILDRHKCFDGEQRVYRHLSGETGCPMEVALYVPPAAAHGPVPVLIYLSGLTCTWANVTEKAGAQRWASEYGVMLVCPDTSPRGCDLPGEDDAYDFGTGAGFYLDARLEPWSRHYRMYSYVVQELPALLAANLAAQANTGRLGVFGHSMGGHGALVCALRNPDRFRSVSAFAPIVTPTRVPWGRKAFAGYLGADESLWADWDSTVLAARTAWRKPILIDQGEADTFLDTQLEPDRFAEACRGAGIPLTLRRQPGYDHSYYFIATFMADHIRHHAAALYTSEAGTKPL